MSLIINSSRTAESEIFIAPQGTRSPGRDAAAAGEFPGAGTGRLGRPAGAAWPSPWARLFGVAFGDRPKMGDQGAFLTLRAAACRTSPLLFIPISALAPAGAEPEKLQPPL